MIHSLWHRLTGRKPSSALTTSRSVARERAFCPQLETLEDRRLLTTIVGLTNVGRSLVRFDSASPGAVTPIGIITGLVAGDTISDIDFRPATGGLYGLGTNAGGTVVHLYLINPLTAAATQVGGNIALPQATGTGGATNTLSIDFNPVVDQLRVVSASSPGDNFIINSDTGAPTANTALNGVAGEVVFGVAYTNNFAGASSTTLYDINFGTNPRQLLIQNPPNNGSLAVVGSLGVAFSSAGGFDIERGTGIAYATSIFPTAGVTGFFTIDLATGTASLVGTTVLPGFNIIGLSVAPATQFRVTGFPSPTVAGQSGTFTVSALDAYGVAATGYNGTVKFSSSDPAAVLPANVALVNGTGTFTATFNTAGTQSLTVTDVNVSTLTGSQSGIVVNPFTPPPSPTVVPLVATGADAGGGPQVNVYSITGAVVTSFNAFAPGFTGGVRVAVGDVNGDGVFDIVAAAGPGGGPQVAIFDGKTFKQITTFFAFTSTFTGGVYVAVGDVNKDGFADIICGADKGGGPQVVVFDGKTGAMLKSFFAYASTFTGGVRVAAGDIDGDGFLDIVTGAGPGGGPEVRAFKFANLALLADFFAYGSGFTGGVYVASGDVNGDRKDDFITGAGAGGGPQVSIFSGANQAMLNSFFGLPSSFTGGVRVGFLSLGTTNVIFTAAGPGGLSQSTAFDASTLAVLNNVLAYGPTFTGGVFVAG